MDADEKRVKPHQVGWLRRPEHDQGERGRAWQLPNGRLVTLTGDFAMPVSFWKNIARHASED